VTLLASLPGPSAANLDSLPLPDLAAGPGQRAEVPAEVPLELSVLAGTGGMLPGAQ
jgi:hypothetical protein